MLRELSELDTELWTEAEGVWNAIGQLGGTTSQVLNRAIQTTVAVSKKANQQKKRDAKLERKEVQK